MSPRVGVVGGGLAGITAALACADAGCAVTVLESRARLGGLATSYRRGLLEIDNGQHVFLRCCIAYRALLERLGVTGLVALQDRLDVPVLRPGRRPSRLRRSGLPRVPAPLHLAPALLRYAPLSPVRRLRAMRAARALRPSTRPTRPPTPAASATGSPRTARIPPRSRPCGTFSAWPR